jgi:glycerate 2-kinase
MAGLKQLARRVFQQTLAAVDIPGVMQRKLLCTGRSLQCASTQVDLTAFHRIHIIAIGKAAHAMLEGLTAVLPAGATFDGIVSAPTAPVRPFPGVQYFVGGHPIPNLDSRRAAQSILDLLKDCDSQTLVFFLLSGGGSALVELPLDPQQTIEDVEKFYAALVTCGAPIHDLGVVRRHYSATKGGRLATAAGSATKITLAVSDVPAGHETALASGPTVPDVFSVADVHRVLDAYGLRNSLPGSLKRWIDNDGIPETPKASDPAFANAHFCVLLGLDDLFHPAHHAAEASGCITCCDNITDDWPVEKAAEYLIGQLSELGAANPHDRVALIADGELSSPVSGDGVGGRNSAFVLACVEKIAGRRVAVLSAGTDGIDGNSPAAGAVADGDTLARARALGVDPVTALRASDAYSFFAKLNDAIVTGPTGTNLRDLRLLIAESESLDRRK